MARTRAPVSQLPLALHLPDSASWDQFIGAGANREVLEQVRRFCQNDRGGVLYLWGEHASGKTHLLQAACREDHERDGQPAYVPLAQAREWSPAIFEGLEQLTLIALDDLDRIAGERAWELSFMDLYHRAVEHGTRLLLSASAGPAAAGFLLPDLRSRLGAGLVYRLEPLGDADKLVWLTQRASSRGMELSEECARYLMERQSRDLASLADVLERLDAASLAQQRRLTIPFIKSVLGSR